MSHASVSTNAACAPLFANVCDSHRLIKKNRKRRGEKQSFTTQSCVLSVRSENGHGTARKAVKWLSSPARLDAAWQGFLSESRFGVDLLSSRSTVFWESATPSSCERENTSLSRKDGCCLGRPYGSASARMNAFVYGKINPDDQFSLFSVNT